MEMDSSVENSFPEYCVSGCENDEVHQAEDNDKSKTMAKENKLLKNHQVMNNCEDSNHRSNECLRNSSSEFKNES